MNILVIGNGFDLAHGLPTRYTDFLEWIVGEYKFYYMLRKQGAQLTNLIDPITLKISPEIDGIEIHQRINHQEEIWNCIDNNVWIEYFLAIYADRDNISKNGWIDFEGEISRVIKSLDDDMNTLSGQRIDLEDKIQHITNKFLRQKWSHWISKKTYRELRDTLLSDLNNLIRAFEFYLTEYIEKIDITSISPDVKEIVASTGKLHGVKQTLYSNVISFNYTNTYEKIYWNEKNFMNRREIDYVHGKANSNNSAESNNMVIGIDEYLGKKKRNKYIEFIAFKKFYQRIYKQTGCKYKNWVETIHKSEENGNAWIYSNEYFKDKFNNLFFFGHSLDITDKDVLRELILHDNVYTTIFYHDKDAMGQQIANLVKVIGQNELIKRTGGSTKTIEFKLQKPMVPIKANNI